MTTQFSKKTANKGCYNNLEQFPETLDINGIIDLPIPISDKFWFIYKNSDLSFNEMQILNLNLAKVNIAHYKELCGEKALAEIIKITELHEQFVIKLINGDAADLAADIPAYRVAYLAADIAADIPADRAAYRVAYLAAYRAADIAADRAADLAAYLAADRAADRAADLAADIAAYLAAYRVADIAAYLAADHAADRAADIAAENNILKMLKDFFVNPIIIQI